MLITSSKKPMETRQSELHDAISPLLVELTASRVSDWIRDKQLSQFLLAVVQYCSDDVTAVLENVVKLLEQPFDEEVGYYIIKHIYTLHLLYIRTLIETRA